jgi:hypothetical protein
MGRKDNDETLSRYRKNRIDTLRTGLEEIAHLLDWGV